MSFNNITWVGGRIQLCQPIAAFHVRVCVRVCVRVLVGRLAAGPGDCHQIFGQTIDRWALQCLFPRTLIASPIITQQEVNKVSLVVRCPTDRPGAGIHGGGAAPDAARRANRNTANRVRLRPGAAAGVQYPSSA